MTILNQNNLQKSAGILFITCLLFIVFSFVDILLCFYDIIEITAPYFFVGLCLLVITLPLLGILRKWKHFFLLLFLGVGNLIFLFNFILSLPISLERPIKNSQYLLEANMHHYKIKKQNCCYNKVITSKSSEIFFTPNMKTGIVPYFEATLVSESSESLFLEIKASGKPTIIDTISKFKNEIKNK